MTRIFSLLVCLLLTASIAWAQQPVEHVFLVSVDGLLPACYLGPDAHGLKVPNLRRMATHGVSAGRVFSVFPSVTYPAHTSVATGVPPARHGIVTNRAWDPLQKNQRGWRWYAEDIQQKTLWQAAREKDLRIALIWWPVTVGARADLLVPEIWRAETLEDIKLVRALSSPGVLGAVHERFPQFGQGFRPPAVRDSAVTDLAVYAIESLHPHLLMLHMTQVDHWQHEAGLFSDPSRAAVEEADRQLGRIIAAAQRAGIWERSILVVVSDHGFMNIRHSVRPGVLLAQHNLIELDERGRPLTWKAAIESSTGSAYLYVKDADDKATQAALLETFLPLAHKPGSGIAKVYRHEEILAMGGDPQAFLALEAAPGYAISGQYAGEYIIHAQGAAHGYAPDKPEMSASLLIYGPSIEPRKLGSARLIDVAPTIAGWLGLDLKSAEGSPLPVRLKGGSPATAPQ